MKLAKLCVIVTPGEIILVVCVEGVKLFTNVFWMLGFKTPRVLYYLLDILIEIKFLIPIVQSITNVSNVCCRELGK